METPEMVIDAKGDIFSRGAIEADVDGRKKFIMLEARQVELLLQLLGIVGYEPEKNKNK
jgi:hypothetical protein